MCIIWSNQQQCPAHSQIMATQQDPKSDAKTGPSAGGKETYRYGASSFRIKTNEGCKINLDV